MIEELYCYASPKIAVGQKSPFDLSHVMCVALYSFLIVVVDITVGLLATALYLGVSFLTFLDKDIKSRLLKLIMLGCLDIIVVSLYFFTKVFPNYRIVFWSIVFGTVFFVIYEIVVFTKIKKKRYSSSVNSTSTTVAVSGSTLFLFVIIFRIFNKNSGLKFLIVISIVLISSAVVFFDMILVQKLVIYLITKNKVQIKCDDVKEIDSNKKNS